MGSALRDRCRGSGGATSALDLCLSGALGADHLDFEPNTQAVNCTGPNDIGMDPVQLLVVGNPASATASTPALSLGVSIAWPTAPTHPAGSSSPLMATVPGCRSTHFQPTARPSRVIRMPPVRSLWVPHTIFRRRRAHQPGGAGEFLIGRRRSDPVRRIGGRLAAPVTRQKAPDRRARWRERYFLGFSAPLTTTIAGCENDAALRIFRHFGGGAACRGSAALMMQANPAVTAGQINAALQDSALPMSAAPNFDSGYGFIQADAALALLPPAPPALAYVRDRDGRHTGELDWSSISTTGCTASGAWSGAQATSGSLASHRRRPVR